MFSKTVVFGLIVCVGTTTASLLYWYNKRKNSAPKKWTPIGKIKSVYIYPLKSGSKLKVNRALCNEFGLQHMSSPQLQDRCLVVYRAETKEFITARTYPSLMLIETVGGEPKHFKMSAPKMEPIKIMIPSPETSSKTTIFMWVAEQVSLVDCGDEAARWISMYTLGKEFGLRLGYHDTQFKRSGKQFLEVFPNLKNSTMGIYSDIASLLLLTESSLKDLLCRIPDSGITEENFRPNLVIAGDNLKPYEEDDWEWIRIGDVILKTNGSCGRCSMTTIDPETTKFLKSYEPVKTLRTYRPINKFDPKLAYPNFGIYLGVHSNGILNVDDTVYLGHN